MIFKSFNRSSVIKLEFFLDSYNNLSSGMKNGNQPLNQEIRSLITEAENKYNFFVGMVFPEDNYIRPYDYIFY